MMTLCHNETIIDSCEGNMLIAVHHGSPLATAVKFYRVHLTDGTITPEFSSVSAAESYFDDHCNAPFYQGIKATTARKAKLSPAECD